MWNQTLRVSPLLFVTFYLRRLSAAECFSLISSHALDDLQYVDFGVGCQVRPVSVQESMKTAHLIAL